MPRLSKAERARRLTLAADPRVSLPMAAQTLGMRREALYLWCHINDVAWIYREDAGHYDAPPVRSREALRRYQADLVRQAGDAALRKHRAALALAGVEIER